MKRVIFILLISLQLCCAFDYSSSSMERSSSSDELDSATAVLHSFNTWFIEKHLFSESNLLFLKENKKPVLLKHALNQNSFDDLFPDSPEQALFYFVANYIVSDFINTTDSLSSNPFCSSLVPNAIRSRAQLYYKYANSSTADLAAFMEQVPLACNFFFRHCFFEKYMYASYEKKRGKNVINLLYRVGFKAKGDLLIGASKPWVVPQSIEQYWVAEFHTNVYCFVEWVFYLHAIEHLKNRIEEHGSIYWTRAATVAMGPLAKQSHLENLLVNTDAVILAQNMDFDGNDLNKYVRLACLACAMFSEETILATKTLVRIFENLRRPQPRAAFVFATVFSLAVSYNVQYTSSNQTTRNTHLHPFIPVVAALKANFTESAFRFFFANQVFSQLLDEPSSAQVTAFLEFMGKNFDFLNRATILEMIKVLKKTVFSHTNRCSEQYAVNGISALEKITLMSQIYIKFLAYDALQILELFPNSLEVHEALCEWMSAALLSGKFMLPKGSVISVTLKQNVRAIARRLFLNKTQARKLERAINDADN